MPLPIKFSLLHQSSNTLEDDTCRFSVYSAGNEALAIQAELETYWGMKQFKYSLTKTEFIWHSGYPPELKSVVPSQLDGTLHYGISLQDEWFLVWCLFEISKTFDCQIQVNDNDGEFLLIEAADNLPKWVTPDLAKGRVWIQKGSLHLIPLEATPTVQDDLPTPLALEILRARSHSTIASAPINSTIHDRIHGASPQLLTESHLFNSEAYLHVSIAKALQIDPNLTGLAVKAFCEKDVDSFKSCREMIKFPPQTPCAPQTKIASTTNWPYCLVRMTRPLYAVLLNNETTFHPPKPFEKVGWMDVDRENSVEWKRRLVGMKLSCGFEMMLSTVNSSRTTCDPVFNGRSRRYQSYLDKLIKAGYFQGEVQGSLKWVELESIAKKAYSDNLKPNDLISRFDSAVGQSVLSDDLIHSVEGGGESDEWLDLNEEQLKALLKEGVPTNLSALEKQEQDSDAEMKKMQSFASQMEKFVDGRGSIEGALHSDDEMTDDEDESENSSVEDSEQEELRADILPGRNNNKGNKRAFKGPTRTSNGEYDEESKKRLAKLVPGLSDAEWGQSSQKPTDSFDDPPLVDDSLPIEASSNMAHQSTTQNKNSLLPSQESTKSSAENQPATTDDTPPRANLTTKNKKPLPKLTKQSYDGVCEDSSGEDTDSDDLTTPSGLEKQANAEVVEDIDMDGERDDFLKFAQEALGLTSEQYEAILDTRRERGAYVPPPLTSKASHNETNPEGTDVRSDPLVDSNDPKVRSSASKGKQPERSVRFEADSELTDKDEQETASSSDDEGDITEDREANVDLDTFDRLMDRMEEELQKKKGGRGGRKGGPIPANPFGPDLGGGSGVEMKDLSDEDEDSDVEMDDVDQAIHSELADLMKQSGVHLDGHSHDQPDYSVISNFLESFKSQVGLPGPVGNMAGRIGFDFLSPKAQDKKP
ncbi:hypothetical protein Pst134EA_013425 [Puccinia striiformis f. sp. tritici]|uniref:hypothetical protein n=1 Tax=Puccinia striiformis f. sp. tritici TaxID=168172 RepID=UPI002007C6C3|nr:hypothetical protein Pst134EA_013425 [Puccinia striiformis f. sp. tritici]KAH9465544.1 hypothetical protein Pst134EA_013425 [Puccinia striiformis f. sp. tritici]